LRPRPLPVAALVAGRSVPVTMTGNQYRIDLCYLGEMGGGKHALLFDR
jgi:hypothetical protein